MSFVRTSLISDNLNISFLETGDIQFNSMVRGVLIQVPRKLIPYLAKMIEYQDREGFQWADSDVPYILKEQDTEFKFSNVCRQCGKIMEEESLDNLCEDCKEYSFKIIEME